MFTQNRFKVGVARSLQRKSGCVVSGAKCGEALGAILGC